MANRDIAFVSRRSSTALIYDIADGHLMNTFGVSYLPNDIDYFEIEGENLLLSGTDSYSIVSLDGISKTRVMIPKAAEVDITGGAKPIGGRNAAGKFILFGTIGDGTAATGDPAFHRFHETSGVHEATIPLDASLIGAIGNYHNFLGKTTTSCWIYAFLGADTFVKVDYATGAILDSFAAPGAISGSNIQQISATKYAKVVDEGAGDISLWILDFTAKTYTKQGMNMTLPVEVQNLASPVSVMDPERNLRVDFDTTILQIADIDGTLSQASCNWTTGVCTGGTTDLFPAAHPGDPNYKLQYFSGALAFNSSGTRLVGYNRIIGLYVVNTSTFEVVVQNAQLFNGEEGDYGHTAYILQIMSIPVYEVSGTVTVDSAFAARELSLIDQETGIKIGDSVMSNASTGVYSLQCLTTDKKAVVCAALPGTDFQAHGHLTPTIII